MAPHIAGEMIVLVGYWGAKIPRDKLKGAFRECPAYLRYLDKICPDAILGLASVMLGKSKKQNLPNGVLWMVMNPMLQSKKSHLKNTFRI